MLSDDSAAPGCRSTALRGAGPARRPRAARRLLPRDPGRAPRLGRVPRGDDRTGQVAAAASRRPGWGPVATGGFPARLADAEAVPHGHRPHRGHRLGASPRVAPMASPGAARRDADRTPERSAGAGSPCGLGSGGASGRIGPAVVDADGALDRPARSATLGVSDPEARQLHLVRRPPTRSVARPDRRAGRARRPPRRLSWTTCRCWSRSTSARLPPRRRGARRRGDPGARLVRPRTGRGRRPGADRGAGGRRPAPCRGRRVAGQRGHPAPARSTRSTRCGATGWCRSTTTSCTAAAPRARRCRPCPVRRVVAGAGGAAGAAPRARPRAAGGPGRPHRLDERARPARQGRHRPAGGGARPRGRRRARLRAGPAGPGVPSVRGQRPGHGARLGAGPGRLAEAVPRQRRPRPGGARARAAGGQPGARGGPGVPRLAAARPQEVGAYADLKRELAATRSSTTDYTAAKEPWVALALGRARAWAGETQWSA